MESFASIVRTLLERIRAIQTAYTADRWPPSVDAVTDRSLYKVRPTAWGLDEEVLPPYRGATPETAAAATPETDELPASTTPIVERRAASPRWRLDLAARGLPPTRGLLST
ncbi:MAG: hypothetical protein GY719_08835 [bacterium]|nr:hypothetical protein [bacterium]